MNPVWKKTAAVILSVCMVAALVACGGDKNDKNDKNDSVEPTTEAELTPGAETTPGPSEAVPTAEVSATPTATVKPTAEITPTVVITPAAGDPVFRQGENYMIGTITYGDVQDVRRLSDLIIQKNSGDVVFKASDYIEKHKAEWEAKAMEQIMLLTTHIGDSDRRGFEKPVGYRGKGDIFMTEESLQQINLGKEGNLGIYAHAILYVGEEPEYSNLMGTYQISARLINDDMTQQYMILYESEPLRTYSYYEPDFRVEFYYANDSGAADVYSPQHTRHVLTSVALMEEEEDLRKGISKYYGQYFEDEAVSMGMEFFSAQKIMKGNGVEPMLGGTLVDIYGKSHFSKDGSDWQILSYKLSDILISLLRVQTKESALFPEIAGKISDGVFKATEPINVGFSVDKELSLRAEVSLDGNVAKVRLYLINDAREVLVDNSTCTAYNVLKNDAGDELYVRVGGAQYTGTKYPEMTLLYWPKGADKPSVTFETAAYCAENASAFEKNATEFEKVLRREYKGAAVIRKKLLKEIPLESFGILEIYEVAAFGETPKAIGDVNSLYSYQVNCVWVSADKTVSEGSVYEKTTVDGKVPEGAQDYLRITHELMKKADAAELAKGYVGDYDAKFPADDTKPSAADLVTVVSLGRFFEDTVEFGGEWFWYGYNEKDYENRSYFDAKGSRLADVYKTYGAATDGYRIFGGEVKDASGKVYYQYDAKNPKVMSYKMRQIVAAFMAKGAKYENFNLGEKAPQELVDRVIVVTETQDSYESYMSVYSETAKIGNNTELIGLATCGSSGKWYTVAYYLVRDGKALEIFWEECLSFNNLED